MWTEKERATRGEKDSHEAFQRSSCSKKQARLEPTPLNVTQAAVHKERWREQITQKKKKKKKSYKKQVMKNFCSRKIEFPGISPKVPKKKPSRWNIFQRPLNFYSLWSLWMYFYTFFLHFIDFVLGHDMQLFTSCGRRLVCSAKSPPPLHLFLSLCKKLIPFYCWEGFPTRQLCLNLKKYLVSLWFLLKKVKKMWFTSRTGVINDHYIVVITPLTTFQ